MKTPRTAISEWLQGHSNVQLSTLTDDTDLLETRVVSSLKFVEFLLFLEDLSGQEMSMETLRIDQVRSIASILKSFFSPLEV